MKTESKIREALLVGLAALAALLVFNWRAGQDYNWDFLNYHLYDPFALLTGRIGEDVMPAMMQTYLNPFSFVPGYMAIAHLPPLVASSLMVGLHALNVLAIYALAVAIVPGATRAGRVCLGVACVAVGLSGPLFLPQVGSTSSDILLSVLVLFGLSALVRAIDGARWRPALIAGLLLGAAAGFKLTNGLFIVGAVLGLLAVRLAWRRWLEVAGAFGVGAGVGGLVTALPWFALIYAKFGNPLFPYMNNVFKSPLGPFVSGQDTTFLPSPLWRGLLFPFEWLMGRNPAGEVPFRDARFLILALLILGVAALVAMRRGAPRPEPVAGPAPIALAAGSAWALSALLVWTLLVPTRFTWGLVALSVGAGVPLVWWLRGSDLGPDAEAFPRPSGNVVRFLAVFAVASGLLWLKSFSIARYLLPLELGMGVFAYALLATAIRPVRPRMWAFAAVSLVVVAWSKPAFNQRLPWGDRWVPVNLPAVTRDADALYIMTGHEPYAALIPSFPADARFMRIDGNYPLDPATGLGAQVRERVRAHRGPVRALISLNEEAASIAKLKEFGWRPDHDLGTFDNVVTRFRLVALSTTAGTSP